MTRRFALCLASVLFILSSSMGTALVGARPLFTPSGHVQGQASDLLVVQTYLKVLNTGMRTDDFSALSSVLAANATVTATLSLRTGLSDQPFDPPTVAHGFAAIRILYHTLSVAYAGCHWTQDWVNRSSSNVLMSYGHVRGPGLRSTLHWWATFVLWNGKITRLDWTIG